jgi:hypothetical protein
LSTAASSTSTASARSITPRSWCSGALRGRVDGHRRGFAGRRFGRAETPTLGGCDRRRNAVKRMRARGPLLETL